MLGLFGGSDIFIGVFILRFDTTVLSTFGKAHAGGTGAAAEEGERESSARVKGRDE